VPEMIDPAKAPDRPHPSLTARPTLWLMVSSLMGGSLLDRSGS
jgi:hypothetical protein